MNVDRRQFLALCGGALSPRADLIGEVAQQTIWRGRDGGTTWFQLRACCVPGSSTGLLMTCQPITGSDFYGPVHYSESPDLGRTWSEPRPIPGLGRRALPDGLEEGVCDVVPEYHARTRSVLAIGHNVYYRENRLTKPSEARWPVYTVRGPRGEWAAPRKLDWNHPGIDAIYTCNCAQRVTLADGDILIPLSYGPLGRADRAVCSVRCRFDGRELAIVQSGNELRLNVGRGLLEPSLAEWGGRYFMTIRAEDNRGYVSASADGLTWREMQPWCWDDGEPLIMSTTQQRWLLHSERLLLVYTRKAAENVNVMRWRAPLYAAEVDMRTLRLIRATERVVVPLRGDGVNAAAQVAHLGNFHTTEVSRDFSIITVGEAIPQQGFRGDALLARVMWRRPNRRATP